MYAFTSDIRVLYGHVDKMNFVYYGRYLEYFEHARNELLRSLELPYATIEEQGIKLPVVEAHVNYKRPATYDTLIRIEARVPAMPKARIRIDYTVRDPDERVLVTGYTVHGFLNTADRPIRAPELLTEVLTPYFQRDDE